MRRNARPSGLGYDRPMTEHRTPSADALAWARRLVGFNTVSDQSNRPLIDCIADHLRSLGVQPRLTHDDDGRKFNLFATLGAGKPPTPCPGQARPGPSTRWAPTCATAACTAVAAPT